MPLQRQPQQLYILIYLKRHANRDTCKYLVCFVKRVVFKSLWSSSSSSVAEGKLLISSGELREYVYPMKRNGFRFMRWYSRARVPPHPRKFLTYTSLITLSDPLTHEWIHRTIIIIISSSFVGATILQPHNFIRIYLWWSGKSFAFSYRRTEPVTDSQTVNL